ncbi:DNA ligase [Hydrogenophaga sp. A37]|uniref:DNA ligase n=1 Tax=Hydrogenophaga sp. A37 TaxID=1945864 RepID=UPI00098654BA|nr:DNA ligase [Hydrogenophaga sp. A37]OOG85180.1 DNA ligase [Hydrogenophaga sp. A37]
MVALRRRGWLIGVASLLLTPALRAAGPAPALMLAEKYHPGLDLSAYWVSEKYDGLRGFWDGQRLVSRGGEVLNPPAWFTEGWPTVPMDGELWAGRGRFEEATSTVRQQVPNDAAWRRIRFMVFDLPAHPGVFDERLTAYQEAVSRLNRPWVVPVPQDKVASHAELGARLQQMVRAGGEGLMLHRGDSPYRGIRSDDLIKLKTHDDAEAKVVGHVPGKGRHSGRLGALLVETPQGRRFRLGTGLTDAQREHPPAEGVWVTYRYRGLNESGLPRFATFLRERPGFLPPAPNSAQNP